MKIQWRDELSVDGELIDADHRRLIDIINRFMDAAEVSRDRSILIQILSELESYTAEHFAREEKVQRQIDYPFGDAHRREHMVLLKRLNNAKLDLERRPPDAPDWTESEMAGLLRDWILGHVIQSDLRMKPFFKRGCRSSLVGAKSGGRR